MKIQTILFCTLFANTLFAQQPITYDVETGTAYTELILEIPDSNKTIIYNNAKEWLATYYTNPEAVVDSEIPGKLIRGKGFESGLWVITKVPKSATDLLYDFSIDIKSEKIRLRITNIRNSHGYSFERYVFKKDGSTRSNSQAANAIVSVSGYFRVMFNSFEQYMLEGPAEDDW